MIWNQFKDSVSHMCLTGTVVASWFVTQEVASSNPFTVMTNIREYRATMAEENLIGC